MTGNGSSFLTSFVNAYGTLPLHGITAIPGKISGFLMIALIVTAVKIVRQYERAVVFRSADSR